MSRTALVLTIAALLVVASVPFAGDRYLVYLGSLTAIYLVIALSLNLLLGYTGQISLGHAGFVAVGAYTFSVLVTAFGADLILASAASAVLSGVVGLLVGLPALKVRGYYLALVTLAFGEIVQVFVRQAKGLTGGNDGLTVSRPHLLSFELATPTAIYFFLWAVGLLCLLYSRNIVSGRSGRAFACVRDSEIAAQAVGISLTRYKLYAFVISAALAGLGGSLYATLTLYVHPDDFDFSRSVAYLMMVVVGGLGTLSGSVIGAMLLALLPEALRRLQDYQQLVFAVLLLGALIYLPKGIAGLASRLPRWKDRQP